MTATREPRIRSRRAARWGRRLLAGVALFLAAGAAGLQLALWLAPFPETRYRSRPPALRITDRDGFLLQVVRAEDDRIAFPGSDVRGGCRLLGQAVIAAEDKRFYRHPGVDGWAILRALGQNVRRGRIHSGASTLSTQLVRLKEPSPERNVRTKCREAFRALQLERRFGKDDILALYLDHAPFGGNLEGVRAASLTYFDREPADLSLAEAALLAGLPNAPSRLRPDRHPDRARQRRDAVLRRMRACGFITPAERDAALAEPVLCRVTGRAFQAPHFCDCLRSRLTGGGEWRSTLDGRLQELAETCLRAHAARWRERHVRGGAVVILETATGAVRAMVGSPDYWDDRNAGQVNGATALRSPGSALKPFLYLLAFDRGVATPAMALPDVPLSFPGGYRPVNFDNTWRGTVSCRQALDQSLNVPALWLCRKTGLAETIGLLERAGVTIREEGRDPPGLGLMIGDCRVRLLDLVNAYAALARLGLWRPYRLMEGEPMGEERRMASPEACWLVADILAHDSRQMAFFGNCGEVKLPRVAWKTGTSSGFRDAWCVAWNQDYVVGVWIGNADGRGARGLTGQDAAVPVAADLFRRLTRDGHGAWSAAPSGIVQRAVCAVSGSVPNRHCPLTVNAQAIAGVSDPAPCGVHQNVPFFRETGQRVPLESAGLAGVEWRVVEEWPAEVQDWKSRRVGEGNRPEGVTAGGTLKIRQPVAGKTYRRIEMGPGGSGGGLLLGATADSGAGEIYWFVNGVFYKAAPAHADLALPWPPAGPVTVSCADARGLSDAVAIHVE